MGKHSSHRGLVWALVACGVCSLDCGAGRALAADAPAPTHVEPQPQPSVQPLVIRPRICLVLSGGGARGMAHIGVLKVLEELKVPIDCIAGTSMGAVVGGLFASGMTAHDIDSTLRSVDWQEAFRDAPPRRDLAFRRKQDDRNFLVRLPLGLRHYQLLLPKGLIQGQKLQETLRQLTLPFDNSTNFDNLPTPFRAVATDLETGAAVLMDKGNLAIAMRASISAPGVFAPVEYQGRLLVDGGLAENLPINVARDMNADVLIVSDVSFPLQERSALNSALSISNQMLAILVRKDSDRQKSTLSAQDVLIEPILGPVTSTDFLTAAQTIAHGETAARAVAAKLSELRVGDAAYRAYLARRAAREPQLPRIEFVRVDEQSKRYEKTIMAEMQPLVGRPLVRSEVGERITTLYGLGYFETLDYSLVNQAKEPVGPTAAPANQAGPVGHTTAPAKEAGPVGQNTVPASQAPPVSEPGRVGPSMGQAVQSNAQARQVAAPVDQADAQARQVTAPVDQAIAPAGQATAAQDTGLEIRARRKSWGPNYLRFGLNLEDDFQGNSRYNAAARFLLTEINELGAELVTDVQIGSDPKVVSEFYQPLNAQRTWFVAPSARIEARDLPIYVNDAEIADFRDREAEADLDVGRTLGNWGEIRTGLHRTNGLTRVRFGDPALVDRQFNKGEYFFKFSYDQLDNLHFPRAGETFSLQWSANRTNLGADVVSDRVAADWLVAGSRGRNTLLLWTSFGTTLDGNVKPTAVQDFYSLGGFFNLSGLAPSSLFGPHYAIARAIYFRKIGRGGEGLFEFPAYLGMSLEIGNTYSHRGDINYGSARKDASVFVAIDTYLGPVYLGTGYDQSGDSAFYLFLGRTF